MIVLGILAAIVGLIFLAFCYGERQWMKNHKGIADKFLIAGLVLVCFSASAQGFTMPKTFVTTNGWATNSPPMARTLMLEWWMQCHPELLTDTVQVAVEYRTNIVGPWLLKTQWMQGLDRNPTKISQPFTASYACEFYRVRSTRIYP